MADYVNSNRDLLMHFDWLINQNRMGALLVFLRATLNYKIGSSFFICVPFRFTLNI